MKLIKKKNRNQSNVNNFTDLYNQLKKIFEKYQLIKIIKINFFIYYNFSLFLLIQVKFIKI